MEAIDRRKFLKAAAMSCAVPALFRGIPAPAAEPATISVRNGGLRGVRSNGVVSFKGVPYAANTAGLNRFKAPRPVENWSGVRDATQYGSLCPQIRIPGNNAELFAFQEQNGPFGEDCCVLNVFTPDLDGAARRPVMFYIHGGGYAMGGGAAAELDGANLANFGDVVVVTINHRLNAFGYTNLSHLDAENFGDAANAGHLDIIAALRWVQANIAAFGGDPGNVTLFGQSGGGSKILILLGMPEAEGLFHRAISMSGAAGLNIDPASEMEPYVNALLKELNIDRSNLTGLQRVSFQQLLDARGRAVNNSGLEGARPVIDGRHILVRPMSPEGLARQSHVPLLFGHTQTEASAFFQADMRNFHLTEEQMRRRMRTVFKIDDAKITVIMASYRGESPQMSPSDILIAVASDVQFRLPLTGAAEVKSRTPGQAPVYLYDFAWQIPVLNGVLGSPHAVDIPFAFGNLDKAGAMIGHGDSAWEASLNLMSAFVSFARTGDPNNARLPRWQPFDDKARTTMRIDAKCKPVSNFRGTVSPAIADLRIDPFNRAALYRYID